MLDGSDVSDAVGVRDRHNAILLLESLQELLSGSWKLVQNGTKVPGYNLWSWLWVNPKFGPGKIHFIASKANGRPRTKVMATIHGQELNGDYQNDENFYMSLIDMISTQVLYELDYRLKNDVEELDAEE